MKSLLILSAILLISSQAISQLKNPLNQADYLIITVEQFRQSFNKLKEIREAEGFSVKTIVMEDIQEEFAEGLPSESVHEFISYALTNWDNPKPQYILLGGDVEYVPSTRIPSDFNYDPFFEDWVSVDSYYAVNKFQNDIIPDVAIGRIPINNDDEAGAFINKMILFESNRISYPQDMVLLADWSKKDGVYFHSMSERFLNNLRAGDWIINKYSAYEDTVFERVKEKFISAVNKGTMFVNYYGHGNYHQWSSGNLFDVKDILHLSNYDYPFITTSISCKYLFDVETDSTIAEQLLLNKDVGSVASIGSSGLNIASDGEYFINKFYEQIKLNNNSRIGDYFLKVQQQKLNNMSKRFTLLGDPAMKIQTKVIAANDDMPVPTDFALNQNYPNPFNPKCKISYQISKSGYVSLTVFDVLGKTVAELVSEVQSPGSYEVEFNASGLSSGIYIYALKSGGLMVNKKMTLIK